MSKDKPSINELLNVYLELDEDAREEWVLNLPAKYAREAIAAADIVEESFGLIRHHMADIFNSALYEMERRETAFRELANFENRERRERAARDLEKSITSMYETIAGKNNF